MDLKKKFFYFIRILIFKILYKFHYKLSKNINEELLLNFLVRLKPHLTNHRLIRLGGTGDGGYFVPDDLIGISSCFTAGIGGNINFEFELANKNIKCFMADYSVKAPPLLHSNFFFTKQFIGTENNTNYIKFGDWFKKNSDLKDNILKIDIEGDEYDLLPSITEEEFLKMRIIIFEIHNFSNIINPLGFNLIKLIFDKLQKNHRIVNINVNTISPEIKFSKKLRLHDQLEITLLRKDR
jgi:hypothetical protein